MAKKKDKDKDVETLEVEEKDSKETKSKEPQDILASIARSMNKTFGSDTTLIVKDDEEFDNVKDYILTNLPVVDFLLGKKGFPVGRISEIYGDPSSGKTALAMHVMKTCIERNGIVFMLDSEAAFSFDMARKIGMDTSKMAYNTPRTLEEIWRYIEHFIAKVKDIASDRLCLIVVDSIAAATCEKEDEGDISDSEMGLRARINSKGLRKITVDIKDNNICLLLLNQTRSNIGQMYGDKEMVPGGKAIDFHASIKLRVHKGAVIMHPNDKTLPIGQLMRLKVVKNKIAPPYREAVIEMFFDRGVPQYAGVAEKLVLEKVLARKNHKLVYRDETFDEVNIVDFVTRHPELLDFDNLAQFRGEQQDN